MRLFLILSLFMAAFCLLPWALDTLIERYAPARRFEGGRLEAWLLVFPLRPLAYARLGLSRWLDMLGLDALALRVGPRANHWLAKSLHEVCTRCAELAPLWWEFEVDCALHDCGTCEFCTVGNFVSPSAGYRDSMV